jgi:phosphoribosylaminoimidazole-succinocarboxamide synthase
MIEQGPLLYEGKAKRVYAGGDDLVIIHYKDEATATGFAGTWET